jgi:hypothetical protein
VGAKDHSKCNMGTEQHLKEILTVSTSGWTAEIIVFHQEETTFANVINLETSFCLKRKVLESYHKLHVLESKIKSYKNLKPQFSTVI